MSLSEQKEIKLKELIELGDYEKILTYDKDKVLKGFSRASTEDQFEKYFGKLGFDIESFFNMSHFNPITQKKFRGWDLNKLISIYSERHSIVDEGKHPIASLYDLIIRHDFFSNVMMNIAIEINNKFGIKNNLNLPEVLQQAQ